MNNYKIVDWQKEIRRLCADFFPGRSRSRKIADAVIEEVMLTARPGDDEDILYSRAQRKLVARI